MVDRKQNRLHKAWLSNVKAMVFELGKEEEWGRLEEEERGRQKKVIIAVIPFLCERKGKEKRERMGRGKGKGKRNCNTVIHVKLHPVLVYLKT